MIPFARALSTEFLKVKRTLALATVILAPLFIVALSTLRVYGIHAVQAKRWIELSRGAGNIWSGLMLPLLATLVAALLAEYEHRDSHWKQLFALPAPRSSILAGKIAICLLLVAFANIVLWAGIPCAGAALGFLAGQDAVAAIGAWSTKLGLVLLCALGLTTIQMWISLRWKNFIVATGSGVCATVGGLLASRHEIAGPVYPWSLPFRIALSIGNLAYAVLWSLALAVAFTVFACRQMSRRDVL